MPPVKAGSSSNKDEASGMKQPLSHIDPADLNLNDKLIYVNRVAKGMKGGKRLRFSALVVTGDGVGHVGLGIGKANEVPTAISKGGAQARKYIIKATMVALSLLKIPGDEVARRKAVVGAEEAAASG